MKRMQHPSCADFSTDVHADSWRTWTSWFHTAALISSWSCPIPSLYFGCGWWDLLGSQNDIHGWPHHGCWCLHGCSWGCNSLPSHQTWFLCLVGPTLWWCLPVFHEFCLAPPPGSFSQFHAQHRLEKAKCDISFMHISQPEPWVNTTQPYLYMWVSSTNAWIFFNLTYQKAKNLEWHINGSSSCSWWSMIHQSPWSLE